MLTTHLLEFYRDTYIYEHYRYFVETQNGTEFKVISSMTKAVTKGKIISRFRNYFEEVHVNRNGSKLLCYYVNSVKVKIASIS